MRLKLAIAVLVAIPVVLITTITPGGSSSCQASGSSCLSSKSQATPPTHTTDWLKQPMTPRNMVVMLSTLKSPASAPPTTSSSAPTTESDPTTVEIAILAQGYLQDQARRAAAAAEAAAQSAAQASAKRATAVTATPVSSSGGGWSQVAICEESGNNDPTYGYFGILPGTWASFGGTAYSALAGGSSWATQVMIGDKINGGGPPWAPVGCANAGYHGW